MSVKRSMLEVKPGGILHRYSEDEAAQMASHWLEAFGMNRHGVNTKSYLWHVFSGARYPSVSGAEAVTQYTQQVASEYVVLSNDRKLAFATDLRPDTCGLTSLVTGPLPR